MTFSDNNRKMTMVMGLVMVMMGFLMVDETRAQPSCANNLVPCANFLNATKPPESCCKPLKVAVETQKDCLCNLYNNTALLESFKINVTQALGLPKNCGITGTDANLCDKSSTPTTKSPTGSSGNDKNGSIKVTSTGLSSMLLFFGSLLLFATTCYQNS